MLAKTPLLASFLPVMGCVDYSFQGQENTSPSVQDTGQQADPEPQDTGPVAEAPVYAHSGTELFEVEPDSGALTLIDAFHHDGGAVKNFVDIAIDLSGHLYGGTYDALYRIDPTTARVSEVCTAAFEMTGLTFTSEGMLIAGGGDTVWEIEPSTCNNREIVSNSSFETSGDLVGLPDGYLYWTVYDGDEDALVRLHPETGDTQVVGNVGESRIYGLGYHEDRLYGFGSNGSIRRISPDTAVSELLVLDAGSSWWGATTNPVRW